MAVRGDHIVTRFECGRNFCRKLYHAVLKSLVAGFDNLDPIHIDLGVIIV